MNEPAVAAGVLVAESLSFGETLERGIEFVLVLCVGVALASHWEPAALAVGAALLFAIRPIGAALLLIGTPTSSAQRRLMGWFGVRGIGSVYYLGYALTHGLGGEDARIGADPHPLGDRSQRARPRGHRRPARLSLPEATEAQRFP